MGKWAEQGLTPDQAMKIMDTPGALAVLHFPAPYGTTEHDELVVIAEVSCDGGDDWWARVEYADPDGEGVIRAYPSLNDLSAYTR